jgi:hypothetical protein
MENCNLIPVIIFLKLYTFSTIVSKYYNVFKEVKRHIVKVFMYCILTTTIQYVNNALICTVYKHCIDLYLSQFPNIRGVLVRVVDPDEQIRV